MLEPETYEPPAGSIITELYTKDRQRRKAMYPNNPNGYNGNSPYQGNYNGSVPPYHQYSPQPPYGGFYGQPIWLDPHEAQRRKERKSLKKSMNWFGGAALLTLAFEIVFSSLAMLLFMSFGLNMADFYENAFIYVFFSPLCIVLPFVIASRACKNHVSDVATFKKHSPLLGIGVFFLAFWGITAGNMAADMLTTLFPALESSSEAASLPAAENMRAVITELLYAAAIPALMEELAFRGIVTGGLRRWGDKFAIIMGSVIFALVHGNLIQMPVTFLAGIFMGYAYVRTECLWTSIAIHFVNNAMSTALSTLSSNSTRFAFMNEAWFGYAIYAGWILLGLLGFLLVKIHDRRLKGAPALKCYEGCLDPRSIPGTAVSSPAFIVAAIVYVVYAFAINGLVSL